MNAGWLMIFRIDEWHWFAGRLEVTGGNGKTRYVSMNFSHCVGWSSDSNDMSPNTQRTRTKRWCWRQAHLNANKLQWNRSEKEGNSHNNENHWLICQRWWSRSGWCVCTQSVENKIIIESTLNSLRLRSTLANTHTQRSSGAGSLWAEMLCARATQKTYHFGIKIENDNCTFKQYKGS